MKFTKLINITVDDPVKPGLIVLRRPDPYEFNDFSRDAYADGGRDAGAHRVALFDLLFVKCENLEDDDGPIGESEKEKIPGFIKVEAIVRFIENTGLKAKNS